MRCVGATREAIIWALVATFLFAAWQQLTVSRNFNGNWTALFCTGNRQKIPPELRKGTYLVKHPVGYDGQMYRYVAHDPFLTGDAHNYLDSAPLRARRILIPMLAWVGALGRQQSIDVAYILLFLITCFAGTYWMASLFSIRSLDQRWSLLFLAIPASLIATDRLVIDMASSALAAGILFYEQSNNQRMLLFTLLLTCLCRETGFIFVAAFVGSALIHAQWRRAARYAAATIPALGWYAYVYGRLGQVAVPQWVGRTGTIGPVQWFLHPVLYPFSPLVARVAQSCDRLAIAGMLLAFALSVAFAWKQYREPMPLAVLLFAASGILTLDPAFWEGVYNFARPYSPMLLILSAHGVSARFYRWLWLMPLFMIDPRILLELAPQILGVIGVHVTSMLSISG